MYSLKYCDLFKRMNESYNISEIRLVCVFLKNEAFIIDKKDQVYHVINNSFTRLDILCGKKVKEFVYGYSFIKKVFGYHVLALLNDGKVYGWGRNQFFQVSEIMMPTVHEPRRRQFNEKHYFLMHRAFYKFYDEIANQYFPCMNTNGCFRTVFDPYYYFDKISCGQRHCMALTKDNKIILWGDNEYGQMGNGNNLPALTSTVIDISATQPEKTGTNLFDIIKFASMSCGFLLFFTQYREKNLLTHNARSNENRALVTTSSPVIEDKVKKLVCASFHSFVLFESGNLFGWGHNDYGQLGVITAKKNFRPQLLFKNVQQVATSGLHSLVLTRDCKLYAMGDNSYGQLGNADKKFSCIPVEIKLTSNEEFLGSHLHRKSQSAEDNYFVQISTINGMCMSKTNTGEYYIWGFYGELEKPAKVNETMETPNNSNEIAIKNDYSSFIQAESSSSNNQREDKFVGTADKIDQTIAINYRVNMPVKVNCNSFAEIVARRFSLTHYTIKDIKFNKQLGIEDESDDNDDFVDDYAANIYEPIKQNEDLLSHNLLTLVKEERMGVKDSKVPEEVSKRLEMYDLEIMYLKGRLDSTQKNKTVNVHIGDVIKSSIVDGLVIPSGSLNISGSNVTGQRN